MPVDFTQTKNIGPITLECYAHRIAVAIVREHVTQIAAFHKQDPKDVFVDVLSLIAENVAEELNIEGEPVVQLIQTNP